MRVLRRSLEMEGTDIEIIVGYVRLGVNARGDRAFQLENCPKGPHQLPTSESPEKTASALRSAGVTRHADGSGIEVENLANRECPLMI